MCAFQIKFQVLDLIMEGPTIYLILIFGLILNWA